MATRNIVPRATGEGQIGTSAKTWSAVYANDIAVTNGVTASTFTGDLTGDVTGDVTGNVTGNVTGDVTGDLTGDVTGAASVSFTTQGEVGFRGTTHTDPTEVCKQVIVTAGTVDGEWIDGNAKLCLHTYDSTGTNTAENGSFVLQASDGNDGPFLEGKPDGSLKWDNNEVERVTSKATSGVRYMRFDSGLQLVFGDVNTTQSGTTVNFPVSFSGTNYFVMTGAAGYTIGTGHTNATSSSIKITSSTSGGATVDFLIIGFWK